MGYGRPFLMDMTKIWHTNKEITRVHMEQQYGPGECQKSVIALKCIKTMQIELGPCPISLRCFKLTTESRANQIKGIRLCKSLQTKLLSKVMQ